MNKKKLSLLLTILTTLILVALFSLWIYAIWYGDDVFKTNAFETNLALSMLATVSGAGAVILSMPEV